MNVAQFPIACPDTDAIPPKKLAHIVLTTRCFEEKIHWWQLVLGARIMFRNELLCFLSYDDEHHRVALINTPNYSPKKRESIGMDHVAFTFASLGDLLHSYERLKAMDIKPVWSINHGPTTSLYFIDPDGAQVELQVDNFTSEEELAEFFASGAFEQNAIGVEFDPELMLQGFKSGYPVPELLKQGEINRMRHITPKS